MKTASTGSRLSIQQTRLWQLQQEQGLYHVQATYLLDGNLEEERLKQATRTLIDKYEILRTNFSLLPGTTIPLQIVTPGEELTDIDFKHIILAEENWQEQVADFFAQEKVLPFDLKRESLLRITLFTHSPSQHIILLSLPALCGDTATLTHFIHELCNIYTAVAHEEEEPLQYADVAAWQEEILHEEESTTHRDYWRAVDISTHTSSHLPFERKTPVYTLEQAFDPCVISLSLGSNLVAQAQALIEQLSVSPASLFLACWQILLWRFTDKTQNLIGVSCDGRHYEELTHALGMYTRVVPLSMPLDHEQSLEQVIHDSEKLLEQITEEQFYFTWADIQKQQSNETFFFPVQFEFETWPATFTQSDISITECQLYSCQEHFTLKLLARQFGNTVRLEIYYDASRLDVSSVQILAHALQALLTSAVTIPLSASIDQLDLLSADEHQATIAAFTSQPTSYPTQTVISFFEDQVEKTPDALALICLDQEVTYQHLNVRANQLARELLRQGLAKNSLVALCIERSVEMIIGLLGIMKAGGAYVPLDPDMPPARLEYQLHNSQAIFLVTQKHLLAQTSFQEHWHGEIICLDEQELEEGNAANPSHTLTLEDLAYVIYTSGSTGTPKGVAIRHQGLTNYTSFMCSTLASQPGLHFATVSTLAADLGNTVIYSALSSGGCLHILTYETVTDSTTFTKYFTARPIDILKIVPSHIKALLNAQIPNKSMLPRQHLILGGEILSTDLAQKIQALHGTCTIMNHYGPTETTIGVLINPLPGKNTHMYIGTSIPMGKPISNTGAYILDRYLRPIPAGVTGELYIAGDCLAAGYLHQPEQTLAKFIDLPFTTPLGIKAYKTGDLARSTVEGLIEFVGRADRQIKLRGYRVELEDIEAKIVQHPSVWACAVQLREDTPGDPRLAAYLVAQQTNKLSLQELSDYLNNQLPGYMLPSHFVILEALPLNANGKIDYQKLPAPDEQLQEPITAYSAARSPIEEMLVSIWQEVLSVSYLGIHDNFFQLGGHSLLATQVISRIRATLSIELPILSMFESPTIDALAPQVEQAMHNGETIKVPPIISINRGQPLPLSFAQQRLWFLDQFEPDSHSYNKPVALRLSGKLNTEALIQSLHELVQRHEILRTTFQEIDHQPVLAIHEASTFQVEQYDLSVLSQEEQEKQLEHIIHQEECYHFNLAQGPLFSVKLLHLNQDEHILLLSMHHIVSDGWSNTIMLQDLTALYTAYCTGRPVSLAALPIQYADFAAWQQQWLQGSTLQEQLTYWRRQLQHPPVLELPLDRPRPTIQTSAGAEEHVLLPASLSKAVQAVSQSEGVTVFMTLLATFNVLLKHYSGQNDILVGTPVANRNRGELENLIGFFVNTLVIRTDLSGNPPFTTLLQRVRKSALEAYTHQDIPFEKLVEVLQPERKLSHSPLFQVMFILQNAPMPSESFADITLSLVENENKTAMFDLTLTVMETAQGLHAVARYNTDLFDRETIQHLLTHWQALLQTIVQNPEQPIDALTFITPVEQEQLESWNQTDNATPAIGIHELFERQAERQPDHIAIAFEGQQITYRELNRCANQLAHTLIQQGIEVDTPVGLCVERSIEMVVSVLGILKAGGACVPLDPAYPRERLAYMIQDSQAQVIITQTSLLDTLPSTLDNFLFLDKDENKQDERAIESVCGNPEVSIMPDHLAYLIYTSGSTGTPKGVSMPHRALANLLYWQYTHSSPAQEGRTLQFTSLSFDVAFQELFSTWHAGGTLYLVTELQRQDVVALTHILHEQAITRLFLPSVALQQLTQEIVRGKHLPYDLQEVITAGEQLQITPSLRQIFHDLPRCRLHNQYGPAETHVVTAYPLEADANTWPTYPSIGRPIANTQVYILNEHFEQTAIGISGEVYLAGPGVARGYFHKPDRTAERFIPNPFGPTGSRLYRTGDLARHRIDGAIEFLGRADHQIKIRGYRVEPGEIEHVLLQHPLVAEGVVLVRENVPGDKRLAAYIVPAPSLSEENNISQQNSLLVRQLRQQVQDRLPNYMRPAIYVLLASLPLTPSGKIDRRTLATSGTEVTEITDLQQINPRSQTEELMTTLWRDILGQPQIGLHDNFFELGGHSLLATRLISRIRASFSIELPLRALFETPTIAGLASKVEMALRDEPEPELPPLVPVDKTQPLPLSFAQQRLWFLNQLEPEASSYLVPTAVRIQGPLDVSIFLYCLREMVRRHASFRTSFPSSAGIPSQIIAQDLAFEIPQIDLQSLSSGKQEAEVARRAQIEATRPFDLSYSPLLRATLLTLGEQDYVLLLTMHHIISDGWSLGIFSRELTLLYQAMLTNQPTQLPEPGLHYADFAVWQRQWLSDAVLQRHISYWKTHLEGAPVLLALPTDHPRTSTLNGQSSFYTQILPEALTTALKAWSSQHDATLFMTLLTALNLVLYHWTNQTDIVIGTVVANRTKEETEQMIGCFMNFLALRSQLRDTQTGLDLLAEVKATTLDAYAHQDCPFEKLVEAIQPERKHYHNPFYNVALLLQNFPWELPEDHTLRFTPMPTGSQEALLDLRIVAREQAEGLALRCEYDTALFELETIKNFLAAYTSLLEQLTQTPERPLSTFIWPQSLSDQAQRAQKRERKQTLVISATFTADPLSEVLTYWADELRLPLDISFAPYNQVFQQLLDPSSQLRQNQVGVNIILIRLEDWLRLEQRQSFSEEVLSQIERTLNELFSALQQASQQSFSPYILCLCPSSPAFTAMTHQTALSTLEQQFTEQIASLPQIHLLKHTEISEHYPVQDFYDPYGDKNGHVPFTTLFFVALGSSLIRTIYALRGTPYKVIVLDCDNTLWQGVSAEDGLTGIIIDPARRRLQEFLLAQQRAGMLLCLCSKNNEEDVLSIFTNHPDMVLRKEHITTWRINWQAKSQNLYELAEKLQLALDSFILIDDNPLECAEVNIYCPEVLTIPAPQDSQQFIQLLKYIWAFDHLRVTTEDTQRTLLYQQQQQRQTFMKTSLSLHDFLAGLQLQVHITPMHSSELERVAQLTQRTNQFNNTTIRRNEHEIQHFCQQHGKIAKGECLVVNVHDRFGNYGLVGVILYQKLVQIIRIETLLLSCRVLGRGVEYQMLAYIGTIARQHGIANVQIPYITTQRNTPVSAFLENIGASYKYYQQDVWIFDFPASYLAELTYQQTGEIGHEELLTAQEKSSGQKSIQGRLNPEQMLRIAREYNTAERILSALTLHKKAVLPHQYSVTMPRTPLEEHLQEIWSGVLHISPIGIYEDFFTLGGHSLLATQLLSRITKVFQVELPLRLMFEASTIAEQAQHITEALSQHQTLQVPPIVPVPRTQPIALSFAQQRLWFLDRLEPGSAAYNIPGAIHLEGPLDAQALEQSLQEIVQRHEVLHTTITEIAGQAVQNINTEQRFFLVQSDLQSLSSKRQHLAVLQSIQQEAARPFDLTYDMLLRATLLLLGEQKHILLLTMHHIVSDGWSYQVFLRELQTLYRAFSEQKPSPLATLPIQYADFATWQRQWLQGSVLQQQLAYWQQQLAHAPLLNLPTDYPRPPMQTSGGERIITYIPLPLTEQMKVVSQREGVTLFMTLLAAFQVLLKRYSRQEDILVGTPVANRNRSELEDLIGFFVNTLILRTDLSGNPSFSILLQRVRQIALQAYTHQDIPFEKLVEVLQPERDLSRTPFFQVMFILQNTPMQTESLADLKLQALEVDNKTARFDITLSLTETQQGLRCMTEYNTALFERETMHRFIAHWRQILQQVAEHTEQPIDNFPLLTPTEQLQRATWNATAQDVPDRCMHLLFEEQAKQIPDKIAIVFDEEHISYAALNQHANQLAHYLQQLGVNADIPVGICMERSSLNTAISILAILKAGGAYVPLDPAYPKERLAFMLQNAQVSLILTQSKQQDALPITSVRCIYLDIEWEKITAKSQERPAQQASTDTMAYIIYTSGSTGQPKGVQITHRGIGNLVKAQQQILGVQPYYRVLQFASLSFDASVFEYAMALLTGATLCLAVSDKLLPGKDLTSLLREQAITIVTLPPSALIVLPQEDLPDLQTIVVAGEACPLTIAQHWSKGRRFFNAYGPTEATIWSSVASCSPELKRIHIGKPITNTQIYLLDAYGQQIPVGVIGEIYIGTIGLARGYMQRPTLTAERFVPHPYSQLPGDRLYRTGDLARYLPDGNIEFLGRIDYQVKVRGYRIELEEIEAILIQHAAIQQCMAAVETDSTGHKRIVAYITEAPSQSISTVEEIRMFLSGKLPEYMLPSRFYLVDIFPLLPNGKFDRTALTRQHFNTLQSHSEYLSPRTIIEELLVDIWKQVLHAQTVSIDENFFSLGGDSILSLQIVARARDVGLQLSVRDMFAYPTIAQLSTVVRQEQSHHVEDFSATGEIPLTPIQHWFFEQKIVQRHQWNQARFFELVDPIDAQQIQHILETILSNHEVLRLRFDQTPTGAWRAFYSKKSDICTFSSINLAHLSSSEQQQAIIEHSQTMQESFNLAQGPLAGAILFDLGESHMRLLLIIHHLLVDGISWRILLEELFQAYDQHQREEARQPQRKTAQFQTWSRHLTEYAQSAALAKEQNYWLGLKELPYDSLPIDHEHGENTVGSAQTLYTELDETTMRELVHKTQTMYHAQINEVLLTALAIGFSRWSGQNILWIDLEGHGREELFTTIDLSRSVGWFTALYPFILSSASSVEDTLRGLKEALHHVPQHGLGFGILRYLHPEVQIRQQFASLPRREISFNYLGQFDMSSAVASRFLPAHESIGQLRHPEGKRTHLLEINSSITGGKLQWRWTYSEHFHTRETIYRLAEQCMNALREIHAISHTVSTTRFTPSDFSLLNLDQTQLDHLINRVMEANEE